MEKKALVAFTIAMIVIGAMAINNTRFGSAQNLAPSNAIPIRRVQSFSNSSILPETFLHENATGQVTDIYPSSHASETLTSAPQQGDVLIAAAGICQNTYPYPPNSDYVSNITEKGVTWTRQVSNSYGGFQESISIWLGVVGPNADSTLTFNLDTQPAANQIQLLLETYVICEYSGIAINAPLDQTAVNMTQGGTSDTGQTNMTSKPNELWIGAVLTYGCIPQTDPKNNFLLVGGNQTNDGRMTTALLEKMVNQKGVADSGTSTIYNGTYDNTQSISCIATFIAQDQTTPGATTPPTSPQPTPTTKAATLHLNCQSTSSEQNINVDIGGTLIAQGVGIANASVLLSYSVDSGASWNELTTVNTDDNGSFSALWMPSVTGNYLLKAAWNGDDNLTGTSSTVAFDITPCNAQSFFSVTSNSTLSALSFDSATKQLSFIVSGPSGTTGVTDLYIPKSLLNDTSGLTVDIDGKQIAYSCQSQGDAWFLSFTYHHSTHKVTVNLNGASSTQPLGNPLIGWAAAAGILMPIAVVVIAIKVASDKKAKAAKLNQNQQRINRLTKGKRRIVGAF